MLKIHASARRIFIIVAVLLAAEATAAQTQFFEISGTLAAPSGSLPCGFCQVQLEDMLGESRTTTTDGSGQFNFRNLKDVTYTIRVAVRAYEPVAQFVKLDSQKTRVFVELKQAKSEAAARTSDGQFVNIESALETQPKQAIELYRKASNNRRKNKTDEAMRQFEEVLRMAPQFFEAHQGLGMSYQAVGRLADAEREFQTARDLNALSAEPLLHLSEVYILRNEWGSAARASVDAIRRDPQSASAFFNLGLALYCGSMFDLAKDSLEKALNADPKMDQTRLLLVNVYLRLREWNRAVEQIDLYREKSSTQSQWANLSTMRAQLGHGTTPADNLEVSFPIRIGAAVRTFTCRD